MENDQKQQMGSECIHRHIITCHFLVQVNENGLSAFFFVQIGARKARVACDADEGLP